MERFQERLQTAASALETFKEVLVENPTAIVRDAAIQRFEYTIEATWKACQSFVRAVHGLDCASPKGCIRTAREVGLLTDGEALAALSMVDDRNLTSHTYNEELAKSIYSRFSSHAMLMSVWLERMKKSTD